MKSTALHRRDREDTLERVRRALEIRDEVLEGYVFGSVARGEASEHSDIDVAVTIAPRDTPPPAFGYAAELSAHLQAALGTCDVDVVVLNDAGPLIAHRVLRDGVRVFHRDLVATTVREGRILSRYCDWVVQQAKIDRAFQDRVARGEFGR